MLQKETAWKPSVFFLSEYFLLKLPLLLHLSLCSSHFHVPIYPALWLRADELPAFNDNLFLDCTENEHGLCNFSLWK